ncbi:MAG: glutamine-hydrolyzing carbamoyl-phosphate synthase small subunit [Planctomycetia bacterium]|nr:glutamine-hydrolyzing carbamoyl-phosphate synthase small subunit [Planctomycetia bacterium]
MKNTHFLALEDGEIFYGISRGAPVDMLGEVVFNTGMTGYEEIISDPSYFGQIVAFSAPEIGNYGCNAADMESRGLFFSGLLAREINPPSNYTAEESLSEMLIRHRKPALSQIDTRRLVLHLREHGTKKAFIHASDEIISPKEAVTWALTWRGLDGYDSASEVTQKESYVWNPEGEINIVALDFGIKWNILRQMAKHGMRVTVLPAWTEAAKILALKPEGVFFSNGPGDPVGVKGAISTAKNLIGHVPMMGICLGHQILALACEASCGRLKFGHHGCNHPVKNVLEDSVSITSQNHNFAVCPDSLPECLQVTHINLNDGTIEGMRHVREPMLCVQFHPEAAPGPNDSVKIFHEFLKLIGR